jgi:DinB superfamily
MTLQIETIRKARTLLLEQLEDLTVDQFNQIPQGFKNNIGWNMGHMIVVQQGICYQKSGLPLLISDDFGKRFGPGSRPGEIIGVIEIVNIKQLLVTTLEQLEIDYESQIFDNYRGWATRFGNMVVNIDDGLEFLSFHEKLHSGTITRMKTLVMTQDLLY